jgi:DNA repair exonuclease SbcCD nuclease subunit
MKFLFCGDPHATTDSLAEMNRLVDYIIEEAKKHKVDAVVFLGDQYHNHSIIQLSVLNFWDSAFKRMKVAGLRIIALVGNHDKSGTAGERASSMMLHQEVELVDEPKTISGILFVPYIHDPDEFIKVCNEHPTPMVVCHQTFQGAMFENGFKVPDGVEPDALPQEQILSGHIHMPQISGKVHYPGAPRWRSVSDANVERHLWVVDHTQNGLIGNITKLPTAGVCKPIWCLKDTPEAPATIPDGEATIVVDIHGPETYVDGRKLELEQKYPGIRLRTFAETAKSVRVKESDGLPVALQKFVGGYEAKNGTPPEVLWRLAQERISWLKA